VDAPTSEDAVMPSLLQAGGEGEAAPAYGSSGVGTGADVLMELERVRANLLALAEVVEDLRGKYNAHTHGENAAGAYVQNATTAGPAPGQQAGTAYVPH
jgi:hypothetical protein